MAAFVTCDRVQWRLPAATLTRRVIARRIDKTLTSVDVAGGRGRTGRCAPFLREGGAVKAFIKAPALAACGHDADVTAAQVSFVAHHGRDVDGRIAGTEEANALADKHIALCQDTAGSDFETEETACGVRRVDGGKAGGRCLAIILHQTDVCSVRSRVFKHEIDVSQTLVGGLRVTSVYIGVRAKTD